MEGPLETVPAVVLAVAVAKYHPSFRVQKKKTPHSRGGTIVRTNNDRTTGGAPFAGLLSPEKSSGNAPSSVN